MDLEVFAEEQRGLMDAEKRTLVRSVRRALGRHPDEGWYAPVVRRGEQIVLRLHRRDTGRTTSPLFREEIARFTDGLADMLEQTTVEDDTDLTELAERIADLIAASAVNTATFISEEEDGERVGMRKVWLSMEDDRVRPTHRAAHGQTVPVDESFSVGGHDMRFPHDLTAPIGEWINCRCVLALVDVVAVTAGADPATLEHKARADTGESMPDIDDTDDIDEVLNVVDEDEDQPPEWERMEGTPIPVHGILAPEGVNSGDKRKFAQGALRWRDLPLPLAWQKVNEGGHDGSVVTGQIEEIWREGDELRFNGSMLDTAEADEMIGLLAEMGRYGVSVDVDDFTMTIEGSEDAEENGDALDALFDFMDEDAVQLVTDGRICGATACAIPAFMEAWVALGHWDTEDDAPEGQADVDDPEHGGQEFTAAVCELAISEKPWDGSASRFTPEQWHRSCIVHTHDGGTPEDKSSCKVPIREPNGDLSRAGVHAAAARLNQVDAPPDKISAAKAALYGAYDELGEEPPESLTAAIATWEEVREFLERFVDVAPGKTEDGPGWLTHPVDTDRLRDYWVRGPGAAKIAWGMPGDFNRCRANLAEYIKPQHLSGYCANRHYDALGFWPGQHHGGKTLPTDGVAMTASINFINSRGEELPPAEWFDDPNLTGPSPIVVTEEGRVFGHLAQWGVCHIGIDGVCVEPPPSPTDYAYFRLGSILTSSGMRDVGTITMDTGHAPLSARARAAMAHYDDTGTASAYVNIGEDDHGIWVAGCVHPGLEPDKVVTLRAAKLSGDWRVFGGELDLVAALAVNVPGFPVQRPALAASGGQQTALVAAGLVTEAPQKSLEEIVSTAVSATLTEMELRQNAKDGMKALRAAHIKDKMSRLRREHMASTLRSN